MVKCRPMCAGGRRIHVNRDESRVNTQNSWCRSALLVALTAVALGTGCNDSVEYKAHSLEVCNDVDCGGYGTCVITQQLTAACLCSDGYRASSETPLECRKSEPGTQTDVCNDVTCSGHGTCLISQTGEAVCLCDGGYHVSAGSLLACDADDVQTVNPCKDITCSDKGICAVKGDNTPICICESGYHTAAEDLTQCIADDPEVNPCDGKTCNDKGICAVKSDNTPICICESGYHIAGDGTICEMDADGCKDVDCEHGKCFNANGVGVCLCEQGYHATEEKPELCIENDPAPNPCEGQTCSAHGACVIKGDGSGEAMCMCEAGYENIGLTCLIIKKDDNHNYMIDHYETASDQGKDCLDVYNSGCSDFCDSFIDYKCSTKCTSDDQCIGDNYFCRSDGRCAPKVFETVWKTQSDNTKIYFPGGAGECNYTIDWGDGSAEESYDNCAARRTHLYAYAGTYHVKVSGTLKKWTCYESIYLDDDDKEKCLEQCFLPEPEMCSDICSNSVGRYCSGMISYPDWELETASLQSVESFGPVGFSEHTFHDVKELQTVSQIDIPDSTLLTSTSFMFYFADSFHGDISRWDVSNVTNMSCMFTLANSFNGEIGKWDTSKVTDMSSMFQANRTFNQPLDHWNTSNVTNMSGMFRTATSFNQSLDNWDVSHVTSYDYMFSSSGLSRENWNSMVSNNAGWASMNKSTLGISY